MPGAKQIILHFLGKDEVSPTVSKISSNVSRLGSVTSAESNRANSEIRRLRRSFNGLNSAVLVATGTLMSKGFSEYIIEASKAAEVNKVLVKGLTETADQADELYKAVDNATNAGLVSMQDVIPAMNAFAAATGASGAQMIDITDDFVSFGSNVLALTGSEDLATTAMMDLSKGLDGAYASLDQYGITKESLLATGKWTGEANDIEGYMDAVVEVAGANDELMDTYQGWEATLGKKFSIAGKQLGEDLLPVLKDATQYLIDANDETDGLIFKILLIGQTGVSMGTEMFGSLGLAIIGIRQLKDVITAVRSVKIIDTILTWKQAAAEWALAAATTVANLPLYALIAIIIAIIAVIIIVGQRFGWWNGVTKQLGDTFGWLQAQVSQAVQRIQTEFNKLIGTITGFAKKAYNAAVGLGNKIRKGIEDGIKGVGKAVGDALQGGVDAIGNIIFGKKEEDPPAAGGSLAVAESLAYHASLARTKSSLLNRGNNSQNVTFNINSGAVQLDVGNMTPEESKGIMIQALESLNAVESVNLRGV